MNKYTLGLIILLGFLASCGSNDSSVSMESKIDSDSPSIQMTSPVRSSGTGENSF